MTAVRRPGMDHPHYEYSPLRSRPQLRWPSERPVALAVVVLLEHIEAEQPDGFSAIDTVGPLVRLPHPNAIYRFASVREYGNRVGIFRVLEALKRFSIPPTVAIDAMTAERVPSLVQTCRDYGAEFVAHGISLSRPISSVLGPDRERAYVRESVDRLTAALGTRPVGWFGPEYSESESTPSVLDEAGFEYLCDWPNDEQPYHLNTPRRMVSVPTTFALEDANALSVRWVPLDTYVDNAVAAFTQLAVEGRDGGRSMVLVVRPWLIGKAFRIAAFEQLLEAITASGQAWASTTGGIVSAFRGARTG